MTTKALREDLSNRQRLDQIIKLADGPDNGELHPSRRLERILRLAMDMKANREQGLKGRHEGDEPI